METETISIEDLLQHAVDQDYNKANKVFGDLMGQKINDVLDQKQIEIASQIYNDNEEDLDDDFEDDEEDFDDEEDLDEEEEEEEDV